jgi:hypothetical protein
VNCPETDRLIAYCLGESDDPELHTHIHACETCQFESQVLMVLARAKEEEIPEELVERIIAGLPEPESTPRTGWKRGIQLSLTVTLGFLTAMASLVVTGSIGSVGPTISLLLGLTFGGLAVLFGPRNDPEIPPRDLEAPGPKPA